MNYIETRKYCAISASSTETDEYTVPNGVDIKIYELGGNGCQNNEVKVEIKFDTEVLFVTHGDSIQMPEQLIRTGNGSKKLVINLVNDSSVTETIGGYYKAVEL